MSPVTIMWTCIIVAVGAALIAFAVVARLIYKEFTMPRTETNYVWIENYSVTREEVAREAFLAGAMAMLVDINGDPYWHYNQWLDEIRTPTNENQV